jgi:hypothetical protein
LKTEIVLQYQGKNITDKEIAEKVKAAAGKKSGNIEIYVQPETNHVYYTVNAEGADDMVVDLF